MTLNDFARAKKSQSVLRDHRVDRFLLVPAQWSKFRTRVTLNWSRVKFHKSSIPSVPNNRRGVYTLVVEPEIAAHPAISYLMYVGLVDTSDLRTRFKSYLREPKKKKPRDHILHMIERWPDNLCNRTGEPL